MYLKTRPTRCTLIVLNHVLQEFGLYLCNVDNCDRSAYEESQAGLAATKRVVLENCIAYTEA